MPMLQGIPDFQCDHEELTRAFQLALGALTINTRHLKQGLLTAPAPCVMAGLEYTTPWTRDAAINVAQAVALLDPEVAKNTLLCVLEEEDGRVVIGDQYWDRIIWSLGAERLWRITKDADFLRLAYEAIRNTMEICIREEWDPADGLFRGPAVYGDGVAAYPEKYRNPSGASGILRWSEEHPEERVPTGFGIPMKALSTNCVYVRAFRILAEMAKALGLDEGEWTERAENLKEAVNRVFWNPAAGTYDYLAYECGAQEGLGLSFAILFEIADEEQTKSMIEHVHLTGHGIPCVWPSFAPYDAMGGYGRHSGTVWPHVQGYWAKAMLKAGRGDLFARELFSLAHHAVRDQQYAEIYHPDTGEIYGGLQEGGAEILTWHSCSWQTWSATALLAMVLDGIFGITEDGQAGTAYLPEGLERASLRGLRVQGRRIEIEARKKG